MGVTPAQGRNWPRDPRPQRGAHCTALKAAREADGLLTERPSPEAEPRAMDQNKGCGLGDSGARKQEKGESWGRQAGADLCGG